MRYLAALLLLACAGPDDPTLRNTPGEPAPESLSVEALRTWGEHAVGFVESEATWSDPDLGPRTVKLAIWYPTDDLTNLGVRYSNLLESVDVHVGAEKPVDALPVLVFSHGHQGYAEASSFLMEHLASHGWLVISPEHTGNTTFDGDVRSTQIYWQRGFDLRAALDAAETEGFAVTNEVAVGGHSFGGYTAYGVGGARYDVDTIQTACEGGEESHLCSSWSELDLDRFAAGVADDRIRAVFSMDAGDYRLFGDGLASVEYPTLVMSAGGPDDGEAADMFGSLDGADDVWVQVPTAKHNAFSDFSGVIESDQELDAEEGWALISAYTLAFLQTHVQGYIRSEVLDGVEVSSEADLVRR